jgi:indole-3-glycerol phosphate synthase
MDHLVKLANDARARVENGYYDNISPTHRPHVSLLRAVQEARSNAIITEVKFSSPSQGAIRKAEPARPIAASMVRGGACAVSVLTEPDSFNGGLDSLLEVARGTDVPILMKDIIVSPRQLEAGARAGADAAVIISEVFSRHLGMVTLQEVLGKARNLGLETLVEASGLGNFVMMKDLHPDLYGINNRDLSTLKVDLSSTENIISEAGEVDRPIVSESGINSPEEVRRLRKVGAQAFLVGTSIMRAGDIEAKVRELVSA